MDKLLENKIRSLIREQLSILSELNWGNGQSDPLPSYFSFPQYNMVSVNDTNNTRQVNSPLVDLHSMDIFSEKEDYALNMVDTLKLSEENKILEKTIKKYGNIKNLSIKTSHQWNDKKALCIFKNKEDAKKGINILNILGYKITNINDFSDLKSLQSRGIEVTAIKG